MATVLFRFCFYSTLEARDLPNSWHLFFCCFLLLLFVCLFVCFCCCCLSSRSARLKTKQNMVTLLYVWCLSRAVSLVDSLHRRTRVLSSGSHFDWWPGDFRSDLLAWNGLTWDIIDSLDFSSKVVCGCRGVSTFFFFFLFLFFFLPFQKIHCCVLLW